MPWRDEREAEGGDLGWREPMRYARAVRWLVPPPFTLRRLLTAVLMLTVVGFFVAWVQVTFSVQSDIDAVVVRYARAVAGGDGTHAFQLLCAAAKARTSPAELGSLAAGEGGIDALGGGLRGSGPAGFWRWTHRGVGGVNLRIAGHTLTRYIRMRDEGGWKVCPSDSESLLGRTAH